MKTIITLLLLLAVVPLVGQDPQNEFTDKLDEYFTALANQKNFNGNVIVARNREVLLNKTYNMKSENDSLLVTKDSRFLIASLSKNYLKYCVLKLVEQNKITLQDPLKRFIPDFPAGDKITVGVLMEHKSGLPRELSGNVNMDELPLAEIVTLAKKEQLAFPPGSQSLYSNIGYSLLQFIVDKLSEKGYTDFVNTEVIAKMGLKNTGEYNATQSIPNFAFGFDLVNGKLKAAPLKHLNHFGTGNYYTTIGDLFSFSEQLRSGKTIKKSVANKLFWKDSILVQSGGREGYRAYFYKSVKSNITFLFLANYTDIPFQDITENVIKILDREPYKIRSNADRINKSQPLEVIQRYTGTYALEMQRNQIFKVIVENGNLYFIDGTDKILLIPEDEFTFFDNPKSRDSYIFALNETTKHYELLLLTGEVKLKTIRLE